MNLYIADKNLNVIDVIDGFNSLIWSNRYYKVGDFELDIPISNRIKNLIKQDYYIWRENDVSANIVKLPKIIEGVELVENTKESYLHVTGRDATSILSRRIIYPTEILKGKIDTCIYTLITNCVINPSDSKRKIATFDTSSSGILEEDLNTQITGDNLLTYIEECCVDHKLGFRTNFNHTTKKLIFSLYKGTDRTDYNNSPVIFSKEIDNVIKIDYVSDNSAFKNMAVVAGAGEGASRKVVKINDDLTGIDRRELFVDAKDLQQTTPSGGTISDSDYMEQLRQRGSEKLSENELKITNGCEVEPNTNFIFNVNYFVGDIVIVDGYEKKKERIVESTESITPTGIKTELAYEEIEEDD